MRYLARFFVLTVFAWSLFSTSSAFCADFDEELITAAEKGDIGTAQALLAKGADVNVKDNATLMLAAKNGRTEIVRDLLSKGVNVNTKTKHGETALMLSAFGGSTETVE